MTHLFLYRFETGMLQKTIFHKMMFGMNIAIYECEEINNNVN